ncbi:winged helix-turn-helix transcriptional regulator [Brevibacterium metallidurans]|uniref:Helix-turn-helix domain-containing protein n=1 Tax=Brevibacterium metallidurans TaxID=1482676 RepID=A0ABP3C9Y5_9MICO
MSEQVHEPRMQSMCEGPQGDPEVFRSILARVGDKWSMMLIGMLQEGPRRFTELKAMTQGISSRMLTQTLRQLERDGLVKREMFAEIPPRVEYSVTDLGRSLIPAVLAIAEWASAHTNEIAANREDYDAAVE